MRRSAGCHRMAFLFRKNSRPEPACCVDTPVLIDCGTRAEIVVRVNATSFRAVGEVKAIRGRSVAGMEFVRAERRWKGPARGYGHRFGQVTGDYGISCGMSAARWMQKQLEDGKRQAAILSERFPFLGTIFQAESSRATSGESAERNSLSSCGHDRIAGREPLVITVDLFG